MSKAFDGPVEIDESYFGGKRKSIRWRGAAGKVAVFGILKRGGSVDAQMIANCGQAELVPTIRRKFSPSSVVFSDSWGGYDSLSVKGYQHERIKHGHELIDSKGRHIKSMRTFGTKPKGICVSSMVCPKPPFLCSFKSECGDSIPESHSNN